MSLAARPAASTGSIFSNWGGGGEKFIFSPKLLPIGLNNSYFPTDLAWKSSATVTEWAIRFLGCNLLVQRLCHDLKFVKSCGTYKVQKARAKFHREIPLTLRVCIILPDSPLAGRGTHGGKAARAFGLIRDSSPPDARSTSTFPLERVASSAFDYKNSATYIIVQLEGISKSQIPRAPSGKTGGKWERVDLPVGPPSGQGQSPNPTPMPWDYC